MGTTSAGSLVDTVKAEAQGGIQMTVLGFGTGNLQDGRMEQISNDADGVYHYIDSLREISVFWRSHRTQTIARDVKIQVFNPEQVAGWRWSVTKIVAWLVRILMTIPRMPVKLKIPGTAYEIILPVRLCQVM